MEIYINNMNVFTLSYDQLNAPLLNKSNHVFQKRKSYCSVYLDLHLLIWQAFLSKVNQTCDFVLLVSYWLIYKKKNL